MPGLITEKGGKVVELVPLPYEGVAEEVTIEWRFCDPATFTLEVQPLKVTLLYFCLKQSWATTAKTCGHCACIPKEHPQLWKCRKGCGASYAGSDEAKQPLCGACGGTVGRAAYAATTGLIIATALPPPPESLAKQAGKAFDQLVELERTRRQTKQRWLELRLAQELEEAANAPDWPVVVEANGMIVCDHQDCSCGHFNLAPIRHPRTGKKGVGCCECGANWLLPEHQQPPSPSIEAAAKTYQQALHLLLDLDYDLDMAYYLLDIGGPERIERLARPNPWVASLHGAQSSA